MRIAMWFFMLTKRLYKKLTFLAILLLIPALVLGYGAAAKGDSGMITVVLAQKGDDAMAGAVLESLDGSSQLIRFQLCDDPDMAEELVRGGKVDMAWILDEDLDAKMDKFVEQPKTKNAMATVLLREDNVTLRLAREKLSGALYRVLSQRIYLAYIRENVPEFEELSDEVLMDYYTKQEMTDQLFDFQDSQDDPGAIQEVHYLTAPVRGLLAVVIVLCAMATAMYYIQDSGRGTFAWVSTRLRPAVELGCQLVSLVNVTAVVLLALALTHQTGGFFRELVTALLYCLCCAAFAMMLRRLCGSVRLLATLLPLLVVLMLVLCPVFFDLGGLRPFQYLLPPTYFIQAVYNPGYLLYMMGYTGICLAVYALAGLVRE